jgi:hypothetical protein
MSSITTENVGREQIAQDLDIKLSGEQETYRLGEAQSLLQLLRVMLVEEETPRLEAISDVLAKVEGFLVSSAQKSDIDLETSKILEDIAALLVTAKQMARNKGIVDKLQRISEESQKAIQAIRLSGAPGVAKKASKDTIDFVNTWRPVFQLLIRSREFRQLIVDSVRIARKVVSRKSDGVVEELTQKFVEGESSKQILETAKEQIREKSKTSDMTDEEWETLIDEIQRVVALLSREPTYQEGIYKMFSLLEMFRITKQTYPTSSVGVKAETHIRRIQLETEELVASFTGRETLEQFEIRLSNLFDVFDNNPELQQYFLELKEFLLVSKSEEEVQSERFKHKSREYANRGRELMKQLKDVNEVDQFLASCEEVIHNIKHDQFVNLLRHQAGIIRSDLTYTDTDGIVKIDTDVLSKLQSVLLPVLAENLKYIPMPRMESSNSDREFWLDNIILCGFDIIPENIHFHLESDSDLSLKDIETKGSYTHLVIRLDKFRTELKNMKFYYKKKTFPVLEDSGIVTLRIGGDGARLNMIFTIEQNSPHTQPRLKEGYADFDIRHMDIEFDKSTLKHDVLLPMMTTLFKQQIQLQIEKIVEKNLTKVIQQLGDRITQTLEDISRRGQAKCPFLKGLESAKKAMKTSEIGQVAENRREKLSEIIE